MIEEAEKNASLDKLKKSLVNIAYEYDNLVGKIEELYDSADYKNTRSASFNELARTYFLKSTYILKCCFIQKNFEKFSMFLVEHMSYAYRIFLIDFAKSMIQLKTKGPKTGKGSVIDITDAEIID